MQAFEDSPFPFIRDGWARVALRNVPPTNAVVSAMDAYSMTFQYLELVRAQLWCRRSCAGCSAAGSAGPISLPMALLGLSLCRRLYWAGCSAAGSAGLLARGATSSLRSNPRRALRATWESSMRQGAGAPLRACIKASHIFFSVIFIIINPCIMGRLCVPASRPPTRKPLSRMHTTCTHRPCPHLHACIESQTRVHACTNSCLSPPCTAVGQQ